MLKGDGETEIMEGDGGSGMSEGETNSKGDRGNEGELAEESDRLDSNLPDGAFGMDEQLAKGSASDCVLL